MHSVSIDYYNELVIKKELINTPCWCNLPEQEINLILHDGDNVEIFEHHNTLTLYWEGCGHIYSVYKK